MTITSEGEEEDITIDVYFTLDEGTVFCVGFVSVIARHKS